MKTRAKCWGGLHTQKSTGQISRENFLSTVGTTMKVYAKHRFSSDPHSNPTPLVVASAGVLDVCASDIDMVDNNEYIPLLWGEAREIRFQ